MLAGIVAGVVPTLATDMVLHAAGVFPPVGQTPSDASLLLATAYRIVYSIGGSYVTARLAPDRPMGHALAGGVLGLIVCIIGAVATWNRPAFGPHWYPIALVVTALPCAWAGAKIRELQQMGRS